MADKQCPECGLWNTETAFRCDCGYDFVTGASSDAIDDPKKEKKSLRMRVRFALVGMILPAVGLITYEAYINFSNTGEIGFPKYSLGFTAKNLILGFYVILLLICGFCASIVGMRYQEKWRNRPVLLYSVVLLAGPVLPGLILGFCWLLVAIIYMSYFAQ